MKILFMEKMNDLKDLLRHEIQDLYSVEEQIIKALPTMIDKATNAKLKDALSTHLRITEEHKNRLDKIQKLMHEKQEEKKGFLSSLFGGKQTCKGMEGIIEEGNKLMNANMEPRVVDAAIIASAQKVEHYEICGYGTAKTYANELKLEKVTQLLEQTLNEEYEADSLLTKLAVSGLNEKAGTEKRSERPMAEAISAGNNRDKGEATRERTKREAAQLEPVSGSRNSSSGKRTNSADKGGRPKTS